MELNKIMSIIEDGNITIDSMEVSKILKQRHSDVLKKIHGNEELSTEPIFGLSKNYYMDKNRQKRPMYTMNNIGAMYLMLLFNNGIAKELRCELVSRLKEKDIKIELTNGIRFERKENKFKEQLQETLKPFGIKIETQKTMESNNYRIDFYLPEYKLAIEYDEQQHNSDINKEKDKKREKEIENELHCEFIRLSYKETDAYNVGLVLKKIFNR